MNSLSLFKAVFAHETPKRTPIWFMRQAGRLFDDYRTLRETYDFKELCQSPDLNARVTCMPVERLGVDAAIIFSDILLPLESIGAGFELVPGEGPVLDRSIDQPADVASLQLQSPRDDLYYVFEAIERSIERLPSDVPLIGFAGAPFTLASYLIEGGRSRSMMKTRKFIVNHPEAWNDLMTLLVKVSVPYLKGQIEAGARIVQLFDSWVGQLSPGIYRQHVLPHTKTIVEAIEEAPMIHFGTRTAGLLDLIAQSNPDAISVDWRIDLQQARSILDDSFCLQGNLDPALLLGSFETIRPQVDKLLRESPDKGHIFNLGHGILPDTQPDVVKELVNYVKEETAR